MSQRPIEHLLWADEFAARLMAEKEDSDLFVLEIFVGDYSQNVFSPADEVSGMYPVR
jgi:hypothetical protein